MELILCQYVLRIYPTLLLRFFRMFMDSFNHNAHFVLPVWIVKEQMFPALDAYPVQPVPLYHLLVGLMCLLFNHYVFQFHAVRVSNRDLHARIWLGRSFVI